MKKTNDLYWMSNHLPTEDSCYIVSMQYLDGSVGTASSKFENGKWIVEYIHGLKVKAWSFFPEPYKESES